MGAGRTLYENLTKPDIVNDDNLIPVSKRTKAEQREIQKKVGIASGVVDWVYVSINKCYAEDYHLQPQN